MPQIQDGPVSPRFWPLPLDGGTPLADLAQAGVSPTMAAAVEHAHCGLCSGWGIPFDVGNVALVASEPLTVALPTTTARWLVFMHTSDVRPVEPGPGGFISPMRGEGQLGEHAADYVILYNDGSEERAAVKRRFQVGTVQRRWGENCLEAVAARKPHPVNPPHEQVAEDWGWRQTRTAQPDSGPWVNWLWAWQNPHPEKTITGIRFEPVSSLVVVSAVSAGNVASQPLRWRRRRKAVLTLPSNTPFQADLNENGLLKQVQLDLGQVISARPRPIYPHDRWPDSANNALPQQSESQLLLEYTAHEDACFHLGNGRPLPVVEVEEWGFGRTLRAVTPATQRVKLVVLDYRQGRPVAVKLHVHGKWGEYLAPVDRHRILNPAWFEDYSADFIHLDHSDGQAPDGRKLAPHFCTYINGETTIDLPLGEVYLEISKGFEVQPLRQVVDVTPATKEIVLGVERVLPWRELGWVTADTHVHFLSPATALLEGAAEGVNVVNLLASQWGDLMTNVGDFDGHTTWGSTEAGGDGEYLVRVGTENRQHVLGHISLLGYSGRIISPMTSGGPDESALGDPIEVLLTEWARQCRGQDGLVVIPHFPNPRLENAATLVGEDADAIEMTSWGDLYRGIDPYTLADWYRYLNCGYLVAAVGGTDKMWAATPVGAVRTYAKLAQDEPFTYGAWMEAVRRKETFVTYGPLLEFNVDGRPMGSRLALPAGGGTLDVSWRAASVTTPISRVELVVNGEIRESVEASPDEASGHWSVNVPQSAWLALLVRGQYEERPEMIAAHSTPVMVDVEGSPMLPAADALTILEQIEGAIAYLDTVGTRAEDVVYKRMRLVLTSAHRLLHNRMHERGVFHGHTPATNHR